MSTNDASMMRNATMAHSTYFRDRSARGQIVILFAVALVAIVTMVGLVLDGGSAFAQRRAEQNASDLAAIAGANAFMLTNDSNAALAAARSVAADNGYLHGSNGTTVGVSFDLTAGYRVTVDIDAPHRNNFGSVVGMPIWQVGTTATALSGFADTAAGAAPFIFSIDAFDADGKPLPAYGNASSPYGFGEGNGDVPNGPGDLAWTNYGTGNVNTNEVRRIIQGELVINKTVVFGEYIGQHNNGNHTALYTDVEDYLEGHKVAVPIVDHNGNFQGWATFVVVDSVKGEKKIYGYFEDGFVNQQLTITTCSAAACPRYLGSYVLKLVN